MWNSGSNYLMSPEDWIREAKGEFTDEEYEAYYMYSPRQIKAYEERYPICNKVKIVEYKDGSRGSNCHIWAFGNDQGSAEGHQPSVKCFECEHFEKRKDGEEIPITYNERY